MADEPIGAPEGLADRGRSLWQATIAEYELLPHELEILTEVCRGFDEIDLLRALLADGLGAVGSTGQARVNPALAELRATRDQVGRLLKVLDLPDPVEAELDKEKAARSAQAREAAQERWRQDAERGRARGGRRRGTSA